MISTLHNSSILPRRKLVLTEEISLIIGESGSEILDVGCGDGEIAQNVAKITGAKRIEGVETHLRPECKIKVELYDGKVLPYPDKSFDYVTISDVLHHDPNPGIILKECARVARKGVVIKDHLAENTVARFKLRLMDWVGNFHHGVRLEYNYLSQKQLETEFASAGLHEVSRNTDIPLYTGLLQKIFGDGLHFVNNLKPA